MDNLNNARQFAITHVGQHYLDEALFLLKGHSSEAGEEKILHHGKLPWNLAHLPFAGPDTLTVSCPLPGCPCMFRDVLIVALPGGGAALPGGGALGLPLCGALGPPYQLGKSA